MTTTTLTDYGQVYAEARAEEMQPGNKWRRHKRNIGASRCLCGTPVINGQGLITPAPPPCLMCDLLYLGPPE